MEARQTLSTIAREVWTQLETLHAKDETLHSLQVVSVSADSKTTIQVVHEHGRLKYSVYRCPPKSQYLFNLEDEEDALSLFLLLSPRGPMSQGRNDFTSTHFTLVDNGQVLHQTRFKKEKPSPEEIASQRIVLRGWMRLIPKASVVHATKTMA